MEPEPDRVGPRDFVAEIVDEVHLQAQQAPNQIKNRNESKQARARGEAYVDRKGNVRRERGLQVGDCSKCRLDCSTISEEIRSGVLGEYLELGDWEKQKQYCCSRIEKRVAGSQTGRRLNTFAYFLRVPADEGDYVRRPNLAVHRPKKDQCSKCIIFSNLPEAEKEQKREEHEWHIRLKDTANKEKAEDKQRCENYPIFHSINFDLQSVLYSPSTEASVMFYKLKLSNYNLTIWRQNDKGGYCYFWPECEGKRGSVEIGTCLLEYLTSSLPESQCSAIRRGEGA